VRPDRTVEERRPISPSSREASGRQFVCLSEEVRNMSDNAGSKIGFFLLGLGIGSILAILYAPKSGGESRGYLLSKGDAGRDYAQRKARGLRERAETLLERSRAMTESLDAGPRGPGDVPHKKKITESGTA
jgi:hypothetical protein